MHLTYDVMPKKQRCIKKLGPKMLQSIHFEKFIRYDVVDVNQDSSQMVKIIFINGN